MTTVVAVHHAFALTHDGHTAPTDIEPPLTIGNDMRCAVLFVQYDCVLPVPKENGLHSTGVLKPGGPGGGGDGLGGGSGLGGGRGGGGRGEGGGDGGGEGQLCQELPPSPLPAPTAMISEARHPVDEACQRHRCASARD